MIKLKNVERYNPNIEIGLTTDQVKKRIEEDLVNHDTTIPTKSIKRIIYENFFTLFNIINIILAICILCVKSYKNMLFLLIVIINTAISTIQEIHSKKVVDKLSIVASPKAKVIRNGKIVPLLELGAGFDKNYTGRENIFLYGAVLGYGRQYMEEKYDQIVEFSGLEDFMDVPIKNYSSGMKSKLGFAIATIAEPEILILDEVLSVGDGKFRKKSEKKILDMMQDGTAVLFVSHSLAQVKRICNKAMILEGGKMIAFGDVDEVAQVYAEMTGELDELTVGQKNLVKKKNKKKNTEKIKQEDKREVMEES